jgi:hypothetical protein
MQVEIDKDTLQAFNGLKNGNEPATVCLFLIFYRRGTIGMISIKGDGMIALPPQPVFKDRHVAAYQSYHPPKQ